MISRQQESITLQISPQKKEQIYDLSGKKVTSIENGRIYIIKPVGGIKKPPEN